MLDEQVVKRELNSQVNNCVKIIATACVDKVPKTRWNAAHAAREILFKWSRHIANVMAYPSLIANLLQCALHDKNGKVQIHACDALMHVSQF